MALITGDLPIIGLPDSTEEPKIVSLFRAILEQLNGHIDAANLAPEIVAGLSALPGEIRAYAGRNLPVGFLWCDGSAVSRRDYAQLYNAIGTEWGPGDGSTTFNLPDICGRTLIGAGTGRAGLTVRTLASPVGAETHRLTVNEMPSHQHLRGYYGNAVTIMGLGPTGVVRLDQAASDPVGTDFTGGSQPHNNMQPSMPVNFMIKT